MSQVVTTILTEAQDESELQLSQVNLSEYVPQNSPIRDLAPEALTAPAIELNQYLSDLENNGSTIFPNPLNKISCVPLKVIHSDAHNPNQRPDFIKLVAGANLDQQDLDRLLKLLPDFTQRNETTMKHHITAWTKILIVDGNQSINKRVASQVVAQNAAHILAPGWAQPASTIITHKSQFIGYVTPFIPGNNEHEYRYAATLFTEMGAMRQILENAGIDVDDWEGNVVIPDINDPIYKNPQFIDLDLK